MALTLTFDQPDAGIAAGVVDRARTDLVTLGAAESERAYGVLITVGGVPDGATADIALLDEPPGSNPLLTPVSPTVWRLEFTKGAWGPFRVRARAISSGAVLSSVTRRCSVRSPKLGFQYPSNAERIDPNASLVASVQSVALTEMNEGGTNRALTDFYREMIERIEAAIADGTITSPPLFEQLYDGSLEHISGKYRVQAALQALINGAVQLADRRLDFVYKLDCQQGDDVTTKLLNMRDAIQAAGGGVIMLPPKVAFTTTRGLAFDPSVGRTSPIVIVGRHGARSQWYYTPDSAHAEEPCLHFGYPEGDDVLVTYGDIGLAHFDLNTTWGGGTHYGEQASGIELYACNNSFLHDVRVRTFKRGLRIGGNPVNGNSQEIHLLNVLSATCLQYGLELDVASNVTAHKLYCAHAGAADVCIKDVDNFLWSGGNMQSSAPYGVLAHTTAGRKIRGVAIHHVYNESSNADRVLFSFVNGGGGSPAVTISHCIPTMPLDGGTVFEIRGINGQPAALNSIANAAGYGNPDIVVLDAEYADIVADHTDVITGHFGLCTYNLGAGVKMRWEGSPHGGAYGSMSIGPSPARAGVALQLAGGSLALPTFDVGAEPAAAADNDVIAWPFVPAVRLDGAWHGIALRDDAHDLSALLAPYCSDIFDPRTKRLRSVISGALDALTGSIAGSVISAPASGQRPVWNASDDAFNGQPSFSCAFTGDHFLQGNLAAAIAAGSRPGIFIVFRANVAGTDVNRRIPVVLDSASKLSGLVIGANDLNDASHLYAYYTAAPGIGSLLIGGSLSDLFGRCVLLTSETLDTLYVDLNAAVTGADHGNTTEAMTRLTLGASFASPSYIGGDVTIAYCAVLKQALRKDIRERALLLAQQRFAL